MPTLASVGEVIVELLSGGDTTFEEAAALDLVEEVDLVFTDDDPPSQQKIKN